MSCNSYSSGHQQSHEMDPNMRRTNFRGAIVVVSKCPIPGKSKTRLIPLLGTEGSAALAKAMLSDVLLTLHHCQELSSVPKILLYAPANMDGKNHMRQILTELEIPHDDTTSDCDEADNEGTDHDEWSQQQKPFPISSSSASSTPIPWSLIPMKSASKKNQTVSLQSSNLGSLLQHALEVVRGRLAATYTVPTTTTTTQPTSTTTTTTCNEHYDPGGSIVFLGMDSPVLPLDDILAGLSMASLSSMSLPKSSWTSDRLDMPRATAILCPANDGGYGMLCVPEQATSSTIFSNILWSHPLTAISQTKALTDDGIHVRIGTLMFDIDEPKDVVELCERLQNETTISTSESSSSLHSIPPRESAMVLNTCSGGSVPTTTTTTTTKSHHPTCYYTRVALEKYGLL